MPMNEAKGNMYGFVNKTWNWIKGICSHQCPYCYMGMRWPRMTAPRMDKKENNTDLGYGHTIFVGSSIDMWTDDIPADWIRAVLHKCCLYNNQYLFQSKHPARFREFLGRFPPNTILCTTLESNIYYKKYMGNTPPPESRYLIFKNMIKQHKLMITIEPAMNFDLEILVQWMYDIRPMQVNIGADSGGNDLPEPSREKVEEFIRILESKKILVHRKPNLKRLTGGI